MSDDLNRINISNVREQIARKQLPIPYYATTAESMGVITDYDVFPYKRWFRGVPTFTMPVVAEREAGWRPVYNDCYKVKNIDITYEKPSFFFESACSTVYPRKC